MVGILHLNSSNKSI